MRLMTAVLGLTAWLALAGPASAQGTSAPNAPSVSPKGPPAPVGHRQPRQSDVTGGNVQRGSPATTAPPGNALEAEKEKDRELNRLLNSICRGC